VFHVELRQFPHVARAFNLTREELYTRILARWTAGQLIHLQDREWDPRRAKLTIYEARRLETDEMGMGRGWATVTRNGTEVTGKMLEASDTVPRLDDLASALAGRQLTLAEAAQIASELGLPAEDAIWQLLRDGRLSLTGSQPTTDLTA
jgi:hypothetical protein